MKKNFYRIETSKIKEDKNIFLLSDIHYRKDFPTRKLDKITQEAFLSNPDYICIAGDTIHDAKMPGDLNHLKQFLKELAQIAPTVMGLGNHDIMTHCRKGWIPYINTDYFSMLANISNLHLVHNSSWSDNNITFTGITMPFDYYETNHEDLSYTRNYLKSIQWNQQKETKNYQVLLFHSAISLLELLSKEEIPSLNTTNLILSGHLHGGLTPTLLEPILKGHGIIGSPNLRSRILSPKYVRGHFQTKGIDAIVSTGISKLNFQMADLLFDPSVDEIILENSKRKIKK